MLPVHRIATELLTYDAPTGTTVLVGMPGGVRVGDHVFVILAFASDTIALDEGASEIEGWEELLDLSITDNRFLVYRRVVDEDTDLLEQPEFVMDEMSVPGAAVAVAYRNLELEDVVDSAIVSTAPDVNDKFTTPSFVLPRFSDLYVVAIFGTGAGLLPVTDFAHEAAGATGTKEFDSDGNTDGSAIAFVLGSPAVEVARTFTLNPPGSIGLPVKGI